MVKSLSQIAHIGNPRQSPSDPKGNGRYSEGVKGPDKPSPGHALFSR
jgi:hypothetical protein